MPLINDVSTNLDDVPQFVHAGKLPPNHGRDLAFRDSLKPALAAKYPDLKPRCLDLSPDAAYAHVLAIARKQPRWTITHEDAQRRTFEGVAVTRIFRFRDDFIVRVRPSDNEGCAIVDMRSKSRLGKGDLGANAARIRRFFEQIRGET